MDFEFSSDAVMLRDMLHRFVEDEAKPLEMKYFSAGGLEEKEQARLHTVIEQMGLWGITVPEKYGGGGLDLVTACLLEDELGRTFLSIDLGEVSPLLYACQGEQVKKFLEPALTGERHVLLAAREPDAPLPEDWKTTATSQDQSFILDGEKSLSAVPMAKDFLIVLAKAPAGISAFVVEPAQSGVRIVQNGSVTLHLDHCRADSCSLIGELGHALSLSPDIALGAAIRLGARYVGLASRLLEMTAAYANSWAALGTLLKERPAVQRMLAEMKVQIESARWLVYHAAWLADKQGASSESVAEVRLATGDLLTRATDLMTLVYGGPGPSPEIELRRYVMSAIPMEALELGKNYARTTISTALLKTVEGG
jgi:acyl-CoA dehydrogenase